LQSHYPGEGGRRRHKPWPKVTGSSKYGQECRSFFSKLLESWYTATPASNAPADRLTNILHSCTQLQRRVGDILYYTYTRSMALHLASALCEYRWSYCTRCELITRPAAVAAAAESFFYAWNSRNGAAAVGRACGEKTRPAHAHQHIIRALMHVSPTQPIFQPPSGSLPSAARQ